MNIAVFISPHGFGHAARASAVMEEMNRRGEVRFEVFTTVPEVFFQDFPDGPHRLQTQPVCQIKAGAVTTPPVARKPRRSRERVREEYGIGLDSTMAETWLQDRPFLYVANDHFREVAVLRRFVQSELDAVELSQDEFHSGQWLHKVGRRKLRPTDSGSRCARRENGAPVIAERVLDLLER